MTGSIASVRGYPSWSVYAARKAALLAYARVWLSELMDRRIRVNVRTPGQVVAPGQEQRFDDEMKAAMKAREVLIPRRKNGSPAEIATGVLLLASDDSSFVNGMELIVDGGTTAL
jgi:NAD(P)-dependent dehydrogenase (short-subunit alcohol dehydrogenase family)